MYEDENGRETVICRDKGTSHHNYRVKAFLCRFVFKCFLKQSTEAPALIG